MGATGTVVSQHSWFNGRIGPREQGCPSVASISFHLGTGVFDGLMAYWNEDHYYIHRGREHFARLIAGAARMGLNLDYTVEDLQSAVLDLLEHEPRDTYYIRPIVYRQAPELLLTGSEGRPVDVSIFAVRAGHVRDVEQPVTCHVSPVQRISSLAFPGQTKVSGSYVNSVHARRVAEKSGYLDGIMLDAKGRIAEASAANIFFLSPDGLVTPKLNADIFPGITRQVVMELSQKIGVSLVEQDLYEEDLAGFDGAFLCSTYMEIRAISVLGTRPLDTTRSEAYRTLLQAFRDTTHRS
jgi:branched-chain amino acid aminotransferase